MNNIKKPIKNNIKTATVNCKYFRNKYVFDIVRLKVSCLAIIVCII